LSRPFAATAALVVRKSTTRELPRRLAVIERERLARSIVVRTSGIQHRWRPPA
jgi:hypothetical protein